MAISYATSQYYLIWRVCVLVWFPLCVPLRFKIVRLMIAIYLSTRCMWCVTVISELYLMFFAPSLSIFNVYDEKSLQVSAKNWASEPPHKLMTKFVVFLRKKVYTKKNKIDLKYRSMAIFRATFRYIYCVDVCAIKQKKREQKNESSTCFTIHIIFNKRRKHISRNEPNEIILC